MDKSQKMQVRVLIIFLICLGIFTIISGIKAFSHDQEEYTFDLDYLGLVSLRDIHDQHPNLTKLNLQGAALNDITDLKLFTKLTHLDLSINTYMHDISPLTSLTTLRSLKATLNRHITDWSCLSSLTNLEELTLTKDSNLDLSFIVNLTQLRKLDLREIWEG